ILTCVLTDGLSAVEAACQEAIEHGVSSAAVILNILARSRDPAPGTILSIPQALKLDHEPVADCARYDSLRRTNSHGTHRSTGTDGGAETLRDARGL
ncbi:IS21 family transposase, partial [Mesorhizobium sp. M7A.F.Ca.AU.002.02.1.1]